MPGQCIYGKHSSLIEKKIIRSFIKTSAIIICVLAVILVSFHFWFRDHAEEVIEEMVSARSNGKINLKLKKFRFNYFSRKMELQNAVFYTTDSLNAPTAYKFGIYKIRVELQSLWQLVFHGKLLIESLSLTRPDIEAIQIHRDSADNETNVSISQEMGRIYNSIHDALDYLGAKRFSIEEGKFSLINRIDPGKHPIVISHIHFLIDSTQYNAINKSGYPDNDNMILRTHDQDISLPDGRHRISFRNLRINISNHSIEMDSCTIAAAKSDINQAAFTIFFDTLRLSSVDFGTLYKKDLIKADTVYCTQPRINLEVALRDSSLRKAPSLKTLIQPLTGDLQLGYVAVQNADIAIVTTRNDHSTTFTSQNDNIEITGLHINSDSSDPIAVKDFSMAIRDYETLSRDSTLAFRFDSIKFNNSRIVLSNFTVKTLDGKRSSDVDRSYSIPRLELTNLSWDELLFNRNIKASKATLYYPVMNYKRVKPRNQNRRINIFRDLGSIDEVTELQQLQVIDGQLNMQLDPRTKITLQDADILVSSNELLGSKNIKSIQRSLNQVSFGKGVLNINDVRVELNHVHFTGKEDQLEAEEVNVYDPTKTLSATAKNVVVNELYYNDTAKSISVDGLEWQQATVSLGALAKEAKPSRSSILLKNISGNNTALSILTPEQSINTTIQSLSADELRKPANKAPVIYGLKAAGKNFNLVRNSLWIETEAYSIDDKNRSSFSNACVEQINANTVLTGTIASVNFVPNIQEILDGKYHFEEATLIDPFIYVQAKKDSRIKPFEPKSKLTDFYIGKLTIKKPAVLFENGDSLTGAYIQWNNPEVTAVKNEWLLTNINSSATGNTISIKNIEINGPGFSYTEKKGKHFSIDNGEIHAEAENFLINPGTDSAWTWSAGIKTADVKRLNHFNIKNGGQLIIDEASLRNIFLSNAAVKNVAALLGANPSFEIINPGGSYIDSTNILSWDRFSFNQINHRLTIDSFRFKPVLPRDSFIANNPYQTDYITASAGRIYLEGADIGYYMADSTLKAGKLTIENAVITAYRDATKPFKGRLKILPSLMIKRFPPLISFDTIQLSDATVTYSQVDRKTGKTGTIPLTHLSAVLSPVRNYDLNATDSLELNAHALLMDKAPIQLLARESYNDSLAGIHMVLKADNADMTFLNTALIPLASAKVRSGHLDTLVMDVNANEYTAYGTMKMNYRNLKIGILKKGDENKKNVWTRLINFAANTFLLKHNNNNKRVGTVYFERLRERSFFNYLVKMTISGIAYTTGLKKEKKKINEYRRKTKT